MLSDTIKYTAMSHSEQFLIHLRSALNHLYDPYFLRGSPLVALFKLSDGPDTPSALQRILNDGIAALEPGGSDSNQGLRDYELIMYRYVQQFSQEEVANQLGVSVRHLRREQNAAIYRLGALLWERYELGARPLPAETLDQEDARPVETGAVDDLDWLLSAPLDEPADLKVVLPAVVELTRPLSVGSNVEMDYRLGESLPALALSPVALRQILLNILTVAVACAHGMRLLIDARPEALPGSDEPRGGVRIEFTCSPGVGGAPAGRVLSPDEQAGLDLAARMARLCGGQLTAIFEPGLITANLALPALRTVSVLVIDDNADFIQLVQRETTGTRYQVCGARDPMQGLKLAQEQPPDIILLDVMMPRVDGWEILGRLRSHPRTAQIAVIVCTILAQEELARSLGARSFLRKPVTRDSVLAALDAVV